MNWGMDLKPDGFTLDMASGIGFSLNYDIVAFQFETPNIAISYNFQSPEKGLEITIFCMSFMKFNSQWQLSAVTTNPFRIRYKVGRNNWVWSKYYYLNQ